MANLKMKNLLILGAISLTLSSCVKSKNEALAEKTDERILVNVAKPELRQFIPSISLSGTAFADREANLGAALPGRVEKIYFPEGSHVKQGDLLVSMSAELYTEALVENSTIGKDYERVSRLNEKGSISSQDFDHVKARYEASNAKLAMMKKNTEIVAPFSGTIIEYLVNPGENYFFNLNFEPGYSTTSGILRLMKLDPLQVEAEVNEKDLSGIKIGSKALLEFDAVGDSVFAGTVSAIKPVLSTLTHTATVKVQVRNSSGVLKPGMFAHVEFILGNIKSLSIPDNAILRQPGTSDDFIFIADNGTARRQKIKKLWSKDSWTGVEGIGPDAMIVTSGKEKLHDGSIIMIR